MPIVTQENILKLLYSSNPWWRDGVLPKEFSRPTKRFAYNEALKVLQHTDLKRHAILSGARRVGKTTILYQMIEELMAQDVRAQNILYVSFDHPLLKFCNIEELLAIYEANVSADGTAYLFFDEIQYAENWELWLKVIYDQKPRYRVAATGSASPVLVQGASDSGVGRWTMIPIPTLSFYEYCEILNVAERPNLAPGLKPTALAKLAAPQFSTLIHQLAPLQKHFHRYLLVGGFPELALSRDDYYAQRMLREDVVDKVLKRDIPALFNVRNAAVLEKVFLFLCFNSSCIINISAISKELDGTPATTVSNYIQFLERANLIYISNPINLDGKKVLKARPKIYIADAAIRNAVLMLENVLADPEEMGLMVETSVYKHLAAFYYREHTNVGYFRKGSNDKEIDVVVEFPAGKILAEVKYREQAEIKANDAIVEMAKKASDGIVSALVITKRSEDYGVSPHETKVPVLRVPAHAFLYLLGHAEKAGYLRHAKNPE